MFDEQIMEDVGIFALMAVTIVSLSYFTSGVQDYVGASDLYDQNAQVYTSTPTSNILSVELYVTPGIVPAGTRTSVSWKVGTNFVSCTAQSSPLDSTWTGSKTATAGVHVEETSVLSQDTTYSIECTATDGRKGAASMTAVVR